MNTGKQVNVMIGMLFLIFLIVGAYAVNEGNRQEAAHEEIVEKNAERGARLYVGNCRSCHGLDGLGPEGDPPGFGPKLNSSAFLVLDEGNEFGLEPTSGGVAAGIETFLYDTIACGRTNTFMPKWSLEFQGSLSDQQISNLVTMMTNGRWDLVEEVAHEEDEHNGLTEEDVHAIVVTNPADLAITQSNCGQYSPADATKFRTRDPFSSEPAAVATAEPAATTTAVAPSDGPASEFAMTEFAIDGVAIAEAGAVTFRVANDGAIAHEFAVYRSDAAVDALPQAGGMVDESQVDVVGRIDQYAGGETREATFDLSAGNYLLVCNLPAHYQLGMTAAFTVE
ncbi:MAG TPA: c-type cytochrome [Dehalococcoidia bacterium]|nr:c-type cytochrome [Dehalococcoidia bacterium]